MLIQKYKKTKSAANINTYEEDNANTDEGAGFRKMQTTSAKKRWSKLSKVLLTITRLSRHKTKIIDDPVSLNCFVYLI